MDDGDKDFDARFAEAVNREGRALKGVPMDYVTALAKFCVATAYLRHRFDMSAEGFAAAIDFADKKLKGPILRVPDVNGRPS